VNIATISISDTLSGEPVESDGSADAEDNPSVGIYYDYNAEQVYQCKHCYEELTEYADGFTDEKFGSLTCHDDDKQRHEVEESELIDASRWLHSARVQVNGDSVVASMSVSDPRGAFTFTMRMMPNGELMLYVPHPDDSSPHAKLTEVRPGAYKVHI
jgi:hypothetical protein